ncbi:hypothetical protein ACFLZF_00755, partial [Nanoarchaeota archaeon]
GKCIIYFNEKDKTFYFNASKQKGDFIPKETSPEKLRYFLNPNMLIQCMGYHKNIERDGEVCGSGAYFMKSKNKIFIDKDSGDFGSMNKKVFKRCLENSGLKIETLDDKYFDMKDMPQFLLPYYFTERNQEKSFNENDFIEDDIPF